MLHFPVQVGLSFAEICPRASRGSEGLTDSQSAEGKCTGAPEPEPGGGEPEAET